MYEMQSIIWAFGSMIVLIGIISFLPIGLTLKGKIVVGIAGFVLSIGGLAATSTFPLWSTFLLLLVITFFTAYIIDSRMKKILYIGKVSLEEENFQDIDLAFSSGQKVEEKLTNYELNEINSDKEFDIGELDISGLELQSSVEQETLEGLAPIDSELLIQDDSKHEEVFFTKNEGILDELSEVDDLQEIVGLSTITVTDKEDWLGEHSAPELSGEKENFEDMEINDSDLGEGYLSEIESLLDEEQSEELYDEVAEPLIIDSEKNSNIPEETWLNELWESEVIANEENSESKKYEIEIELEDSELEILFTAKEVAASIEEQEPVKKLVELQ
jgi:hypothetical protein